MDTLVIGYIPKELELISSEETLYARDYMYTAENGDYLILGIYTTESVSVGADIEFSEYEIININDNNAYMVYDVIERTGTLVTGNEHYTIYMTGILDKGELIKIAENIK